MIYKNTDNMLKARFVEEMPSTLWAHRAGQPVQTQPIRKRASALERQITAELSAIMNPPWRVNFRNAWKYRSSVIFSQCKNNERNSTCVEDAGGNFRQTTHTVGKALPVNTKDVNATKATQQEVDSQATPKATAGFYLPRDSVYAKNSPTEEKNTESLETDRILATSSISIVDTTIRVDVPYSDSKNVPRTNLTSTNIQMKESSRNDRQLHFLYKNMRRFSSVTRPSTNGSVNTCDGEQQRLKCYVPSKNCVSRFLDTSESLHLVFGRTNVDVRRVAKRKELSTVDYATTHKTCETGR